MGKGAGDYREKGGSWDSRKDPERVQDRHSGPDIAAHGERGGEQTESEKARRKRIAKYADALRWAVANEKEIGDELLKSYVERLKQLASEANEREEKAKATVQAEAPL